MRTGRHSNLRVNLNQRVNVPRNRVIQKDIIMRISNAGQQFYHRLVYGST